MTTIIRYDVMIVTIGFGGGCHWCTEAVFQHLKGVNKVEQGWIASLREEEGFSEAVIVHFDPTKISLETLIEIHLYTHKSTSEHSMRKKYRSAIYTFSEVQKKDATETLLKLQSRFGKDLVTKIYPFKAFKPSESDFQDYYLKNPQKPFCETYIDPKLRILLNNFSVHADHTELNHLKQRQ